MARNQTWTWAPPQHLVEQIDAVADRLGQKRSEALRLIVAQGCAVMLSVADDLDAKKASAVKGASK